MEKAHSDQRDEFTLKRNIYDKMGINGQGKRTMTPEEEWKLKKSIQQKEHCHTKPTVATETSTEDDMPVKCVNKNEHVCNNLPK